MNKKITLTKEPKLKVHKYVVTVNTRLSGGSVMTKYHYCMNLKEVKAIANRTNKGSWIHVFKADHNFIQAYAVE